MEIGCEAPTCHRAGGTGLQVALIGKAYNVDLVVNFHWPFEVNQSDIILVRTRYIRGMNVYCLSSSVLLGILVPR